MLDPFHPGYLLWIDTETTGLDPSRCELLEIALALTKGDQVLERLHAVLGHGDGSELDWDEPAKAMHRRNGLLAELADGQGEPPHLVRERVVEFVERAYELAGGHRLWLAGCGPGFDKAFLREFCPEVRELLHYRYFDLNTLLRWFDAWNLKAEGQERPHRAGDDLEQDLESYFELLRRHREAA